MQDAKSFLEYECSIAFSVQQGQLYWDLPWFLWLEALNDILTYPIFRLARRQTCVITHNYGHLWIVWLRILWISFWIKIHSLDRDLKYQLILCSLEKTWVAETISFCSCYGWMLIGATWNDGQWFIYWCWGCSHTTYFPCLIIRCQYYL